MVKVLLFYISALDLVREPDNMLDLKLLLNSVIVNL